MLMRKAKLKTPRRLLFIFEILAIVLLAAYNKEKITDFSLLTVGGLVMLIYLSNTLLNKVSSGDKYVFLIVSMLMSIGVIMIYRIDSGLGVKQLIWISIGIVIFFMTYFIMKVIEGWENYLVFYIAMSYLLFMLTLTLGTATKGAKNWIELGPISFQPAELIKILLIFILASYYSNYDRINRRINHASYKLTLIIYSFLGLLFIQRDLGMAVVFYSIFVGQIGRASCRERV